MQSGINRYQKKHMKSKILKIVCLLLLGVNICFANEENYFIKARPVWAFGGQVANNMTLGLHSVFELKDFSKATFSITAASCYKVYINGEFIGFGPSIAAEKYFRVDQYDVLNKLKLGKNVLAIEVVGYNTDSYYIPNQPHFVQAELIVDGEVLATTLTQSNPAAFKLITSGQRIGEVEKFSFQRTFTEEYKLTPDYQSWMTDTNLLIKKNVDLKSHGRWKQPVGVDILGVRPEETGKKELLPRGVKYPDYSIVDYSEKSDDNIYEFDKNRTGFIISKITVKESAKVTLIFDEILMDKKVNINRLGLNAYIKYNLAPGEYTLESFEPYTFKYLQAIVEEGKCEITDIKMREYASSDVSQVKFITDNANINKIFDAAQETHRQNALDIFTDCPSRERAGWLCDSYFAARVAHYFSGNTLVEKNFIENYLLPDKFEHLPEGMLPMCYPADHSNGNFIPNWAMWFVLQLEEYAERSGDDEMINNLRPRVLSLMSYFKKYENEDGLLENLEKWVFVEWSAANSFVQDVNYPTNMLYAKALEIVGTLYNIPEYADQAKTIRQTIRKHAIDDIFFVDNAVREDGTLNLQKQNKTEVCQYYAFFFDVASPETDPELFKILTNELSIENDKSSKKKVLEKYNMHPCNAFIGNYLRMEILSQHNLQKQLISEIENGFLMMANTTGTLWEHINTSASCNHGFAAHVGYVLIRDFGGFNNIDPINKVINIKFNNSTLNNCETVVPMHNEKLFLKWEKKNNTIFYTLIAPKKYKVIIVNNTNLKLQSND
jgi:alpha-L-rhamnosidase